MGFISNVSVVLIPRKTFSKCSISKSSMTSQSGVEGRELAALSVIPASLELRKRGESTFTLFLRFHFRVRRTRITTRTMQRTKKPAMEIPIIIIGFLYQLFVGTETGISSVFALVYTLTVLSAVKELKTVLL